VGGATTRTRYSPSGRRSAALIVALATLIAAATAADARTPIEEARHRAASLGYQVSDGRRQAGELQEKILALASDMSAARLSLDHVQGRLVAAQHALVEAHGALEDVQASLDARARQAFQSMGPGVSATYLLDADSFADLLDRTVMLDSLQEADAALAEELQTRAARLAATEEALELAATERGRLLTRIESRRVELLAAFAAQQSALEQLVGARREATRQIGRLERQAARRTGALPFGSWAGRFLQHIGAPTCRDNLVVVMAWQANEFTQARWNPLATTHRMNGSTSFNSVGVQNYRSLTQGVRASAETLTGGAESYGYAAILDALHRCARDMATAEAIRASAWCRGCSNGGYVTQLIPIVRSYFDRYADLHA
jgi:peptidoglycan hydrolase CwlO-like protein